MKKVLIFFIAILLISCNKNDTHFEWDEIVFYRISQKTYNKFIDNVNEEKIEKALEHILYDDLPNNLNDSLIVSIDTNFNKYRVNINSFTEISKIFKHYEKSMQSASFTTTLYCAPVYRDVLIFKKNNKTIGVAKVCFSCSQNYLVFENSVLKNVSLDYTELEEILNQLASHSQQ